MHKIIIKNIPIDEALPWSNHLFFLPRTRTKAITTDNPDRERIRRAILSMYLLSTSPVLSGTTAISHCSEAAQATHIFQTTFIIGWLFSTA